MLGCFFIDAAASSGRLKKPHFPAARVSLDLLVGAFAEEDGAGAEIGGAFRDAADECSSEPCADLFRADSGITSDGQSTGLDTDDHSALPCQTD